MYDNTFLAIVDSLTCIVLTFSIPFFQWQDRRINFNYDFPFINSTRYLPNLISFIWWMAICNVLINLSLLIIIEIP